MALDDTQIVLPTSLLGLPNELLLDIAECLPRQRDVYRLLRVNRRLWRLLEDILLRRNIKEHESSALLWAVCHDRVEMVCRMVRLKANLNSRRGGTIENPFQYHAMISSWDSSSPTDRALLLAVGRGNLRIVEILAGAGAQLGLVFKGQTPLSLALIRRNEPIARVLIGRMSSVNSIVSLKGKSALHLACEKRLVETTRYLLERGADPNWKEHRLPSHIRGYHYEDLLQLRDTFRRRLDEDTIEILRLLVEHGLELDEGLRKLGSDHVDPRVRYLFAMAIAPVDQQASGKRRVKAIEPWLDSDAWFPPLHSSSPPSETPAIERNDSVWTAEQTKQLTTSLGLMKIAAEPTQPTSNNSRDVDDDPFPPLRRGSQDSEVRARQFWTDFKIQNRPTRGIDASTPIRSETSPSEHSEPPITEAFPSLSTFQAPSALSTVWTDFPRRVALPAHSERTLPVAASATADPGATKQKGRKKNKWTKLQI